ncbi:MAG: hypothetical protein AWM53_00358 [Candidatus Dichloromethanomonas elyunquensis]|nr:MAG: hypothetical protein AWM53_00358 [Candidatus Dichloromethanomonas elyunquensis]
MNTRQQSSSKFWIIIFKVFIFIVALDLAFIILKPLLTFLLGISFWLIKMVVFIAATFFVIYFSLKIIFQFDLIDAIFGRKLRR